MKDYTSIREHVIVERNLARIKLRNLIKNSDKIRKEELRKRAEESALEGDLESTQSYKTLIEHKTYRAQWQKIKYYLKEGNTEPLTRLLIKEQGHTKVLTDGP